MTDLEIAKENLNGHSICLCKDGNFIVSDKRGIAPMVDFIDENRNLEGYSVADLIVGKAAALLFVKAKIKNVYAEVLSTSGQAILEANNIYYIYNTLTEKIINRAGTDICPMEKVTLNIDDPELAYNAIKTRLIEMRK